MVTAVKELNIIIVGVGGQGVVLLSEILGNAAVNDGLSVKGSEVLGMAQRGGPVFSNIRLGKAVYSPLTPDGKCDIMVSLEPSEVLRHISLLSEDSMVVTNTGKVVPPTVSIGQSPYPELDEVLSNLKKVTEKIVTIDAMKIAAEAGNLQAANVVMLGALFGTDRVPIKIETVQAEVKARVPAKAVDVNMKAFDMGYSVSNEKLKA